MTAKRKEFVYFEYKTNSEIEGLYFGRFSISQDEMEQRGSQQAGGGGRRSGSLAQTKVNEVLHGNNKFAQVLAKFEAMTGCKREYVFYGILSLPLLVIALLMGGDLVILALAFVYPGFRTAEAVEKNDPKEMQRWLAYWVVLCVSFCFGWVIDTLFFWLPFLFWMKIGYIVWLLAPEPYSGSMLVYSRFVGPKVRQLLPQLKNKLESVYQSGKSFTTPRGTGGNEGSAVAPPPGSGTRAPSGGHHASLPRGASGGAPNSGGSAAVRNSGGAGGASASQAQQQSRTKPSQPYEDEEESESPRE